MAGAHQWNIVPRFLLRSAGFPFDLVDLGGDGVAAQIDHRARLRAAATRLAREWPHRLKANAGADDGAKTLKRARRDLTRHRPLTDTSAALFDPSWVADWYRCLAELDTADRLVDDAVRRATERAGAKLRTLLDDERFSTALTASNPDLTARLRRSLLADPAGSRSSTRRNERVVYTYAQRLATKNETISFFGPIDYGRFERTGMAGDDTVRVRYVGRPVRRHYTRLAHWAVQALADRLAEDPGIAPHLPVRLRDGCVLTGDGTLLIAPTGRRVVVSAREAEVIRLVTTGRHTARDLAAPQTVRELTSRTILTCRPLVPTALDDPAAWLVDLLADLRRDGVAAAARWHGLLDGLARESAHLAESDAVHRPTALAALESTFTSACGVPARRGAGAHYADRLLVTEDCLGGVTDCVVPARQTEALVRRLSPTLLLCASYSIVVQQAIHARALEVYARLGRGGPVSFLQLVAEMDTVMSVAEAQAAPAVIRWLDRFDTIVSSARCGDIARIDPERLGPLITEPPRGLVVSPDILLCADPAEVGLERVELVIGEVHHGAQVWSYLSVLDPDLPATRREVAAALGVRADGTAEEGDERPATLVCRRTQGKAFEREMPGRLVLFRAAPAGRHPEVTPAEALTVHEIGGRLRLLAPGRVPLRLHPRHPRSPSNWLFGLPPVTAPVPLRGAATAPRIVIGDVVAWRRTWRLNAGQSRELARQRRPEALVRAAAELRERTGLPRLVFARAHGARKPVFADLHCPTSLRNLAHYLGQAPVELTEMLPEPRQWWLSPAGYRVSCEWRLTLGWRGSEATAGDEVPHA